MKRQRTEKSKYRHASTGDYCTCAQYVAAIMCQRNAENKNEGSLPYKFWNKKPWDWTYKKQLFKANSILKNYSEEALVKAIESPEFKGIFSLNHPKVIGIIKKYELQIEEQKSKPKQEIEVKKNAKTRKKSYGGKNLLKKLRKLENGEEEEI
tara:strand:+ start:319 stop:774 length:456 start_codon:yes stop_codon:yes gene_type:complete